MLVEDRATRRLSQEVFCSTALALPQPLERVSLTAHGPAKTLTSALSPARNHHDCGVSGISCSLDHRTPFHIISVNNESMHVSREIKKPWMSARACAKGKKAEENPTCKFRAPGSVARTADYYHAILVLRWSRLSRDTRERCMGTFVDSAQCGGGRDDIDSGVSTEDDVSLQICDEPRPRAVF